MDMSKAIQKGSDPNEGCSKFQGLIVLTMTKG